MLTAILLTILMLFSGISYAMGISLPVGALPTVLTNIDHDGDADCREGPAGIDTLYLIDYAELDIGNLVQDADDNISAMPVLLTNTWSKITFEDDTAFFNQTKATSGKSGLRWTYVISINLVLNNNATRKKLKDQDDCCRLVAIVVDNQGKVRVVGLEPFMGSFKSLKLKTGDGSFNSGADTTSDQNLRIHTYTCKGRWEAPYTDIDLTALPITP